MRSVFQIDFRDNVGVALSGIPAGTAAPVIGETKEASVLALETIPEGHKIALQDIPDGAEIVKYGVVIGQATSDIRKGQWVHLHVMKSLYDERSGHLDVVTGAPLDTRYA